jgi:hypothetical protein
MSPDLRNDAQRENAGAVGRHGCSQRISRSLWYQSPVGRSFDASNLLYFNLAFACGFNPIVYVNLAIVSRSSCRYDDHNGTAPGNRLM